MPMTTPTGPAEKAAVRDQLDLSAVRWRRPWAGGVLEVAFVPHTDGETYVLLRDGTRPDDTTLLFDASEWRAFVAGAKDGEFDKPW